jgi:hypothetical protein
MSDRYSYEIIPRPADLGGGWRLRLIDQGEEVGSGVFPIEQEKAEPQNGIDWWNGLQERERSWWLERAVERGALGNAAEAYTSYLLAEAHNDAENALANNRL